MNIELNFNIGDPLYYIREIKGDGTLCLLDICKEDNSIEGVKIQRDTKGNLQTLIVTDSGQEDLPGSQYACLSHEQAVEWCRKNRSDSILLSGSGTVRGIYCSMYGQRQIVDVSLSITGIEDFVCSPVVGKVDDNGYFAVYDKYARREYDKPSLFLLDADGNPVDAMFGNFLVLRFETDGELSRLVDVEPDILDI